MADHLDRLGLRKDAVASRIRFLTDRANLHRNRANETDSRDSWRRTALFGASGSCTVQAASLAILAGEDNADFLLQLAANDYLNAESPYGLVVQSLRTPDDDLDSLLFNSPAGMWVREIDDAFRESYKEDRKGMAERDIPINLSAPNQQAYLCMALVSARRVAKEYQEPLKRLIHRLRNHPNIPHGPQGQPLDVQLDIIEAVFDATVNSLAADQSRAINALRRLASHYAESIQSAQHNDYLWTNLWSPVDYLDIEIVFAARSAARAFENVEMNSIVEPDSIAAIPLLLAPRPQSRPSPFSAY
jgi:hypothetical protein